MLWGLLCFQQCFLVSEEKYRNEHYVWEIKFSCPTEIQPVLFFKAPWWSTLKSVCCYAQQVEYFPYSFKAWNSPSNPSKQNGFSQYCAWYLYVPWIAHNMFGFCYTGLSSQITPESGTPVAVALGGTVRHWLWCACAACSQLCPQWALPAQDLANIHGNRGRGGKWHTYPRQYCATFRTGLTYTLSPFGSFRGKSWSWKENQSFTEKKKYESKR